MQEKLLKLLNAQNIDLEIDKLENAKKTYPAELDSLKKAVDDLEKATADLEKQILDNKSSRLLIENEITAEKETLGKKEQRLLETTSNKEYTAVQHEIEATRERIDSLETEDLELMTKMDELEPTLEETKAKFKTVSKENNANIKDIKSKFDSIETDVAKLDKKRDSMLSKIDGRPLMAYNRLRQSKSGIAISTVDTIKHACQGCFKQLPPQKVLEIRRANQLNFCENCGRILVWKDDESSEKKKK